MSEDVHQSLMDKAYDRWNGEWKGFSYDQFVAQLDYAERLAVLAGNLNYQVCNGGFAQWFYNDYGSHAGTVIRLLTEYKDRPGVSEVIDLIRDARERDGWNGDSANFDDLDTRFYAVNDTFLKSVEAILTSLTTTC